MSVVLVGVAVVLMALVPALIGVPVAFALFVVAAVIARHALADIAAGATLWLVRPYGPGEQVRLDSTEHGPFDAEVVRVRPLHTVLCTDSGVLLVRNRDLLRTSG